MLSRGEKLIDYCRRNGTITTATGRQLLDYCYASSVLSRLVKRQLLERVKRGEYTVKINDPNQLQLWEDLTQ